MTIQTATENRKVLADHLSRQIGEPYHYLGVPSCGYQVGPYTINRDGSITGDDFTTIRSFLVENHYIDEAALPDPDTEQTEDVPVTDDDTGTETTADAADIQEPFIDGNAEAAGVTNTCVSIPMKAHSEAKEYTPLGLTCLLKTLYARQSLINAMTQDDCLFIDEEVINRLQDEKPDTIEKVQALLEDEARVGMVRGVAVSDGKITMDFPYDEAEPTRWQAYAELLFRIDMHCRMAHHTSVKRLEPQPDEMKYFCRNWLMQLGLGGPEHKEARRVLLGHLTGFAAFRTAEKMDAHKTRCAERRKEARKDSKAQAATVMEVEADD